MMEIIKPGTKIDFVGKRNAFFTISAVLMIICFATMIFKGYNFGIDFAGGTIIQVKFDKPVELEDIRTQLQKSFTGEFMLQNIGDQDEVIIRVVDHQNMGLQELDELIQQVLSTSFSDANPKNVRVEQVGAQVGGELKKKAFYALLFASLGVLIYLAVRFELLFAVGAIISLAHDVICIMGVYSIFGKEFNLTVMAAVLTAAGYSLNDTIVIFDRIREKIRANALESNSWKEIINMSVNETLSRTVLTSVLTLLAVLSLFFFGGAALNGFALVMIVGIVVGTYSSIAIASMFIYLVHTKRPKSAMAGRKKQPLKA